MKTVKIDHFSHSLSVNDDFFKKESYQVMDSMHIVIPIIEKRQPYYIEKYFLKTSTGVIELIKQYHLL